DLERPLAGGRRQGRAGGDRMEPAHAADPSLRRVQGREEQEGSAAADRLFAESEGAAGGRQGPGLRRGQPQIVRHAAGRTGRQAARQPGAAETQLRAGRGVVGPEPREDQCHMVQMDSVVAERGPKRWRQWPNRHPPAPIAIKEAIGGRGAIELRGLSKRYGEETVVDAVAVSIAPGEFFSLLGPSGSGKTT